MCGHGLQQSRPAGDLVACGPRVAAEDPRALAADAGEGEGAGQRRRVFGTGDCGDHGEIMEMRFVRYDTSWGYYIYLYLYLDMCIYIDIFIGYV